MRKGTLVDFIEFIDNISKSSISFKYIVCFEYLKAVEPPEGVKPFRREKTVGN